MKKAPADGIDKMGAFRFFVIASIFIMSHLQANDAFYAISSLRFYLDDGNESVQFNESDVLSLWEKASSDDMISDKVVEARQLYWKGDLIAAEIRLQDAWTQLFECRLPKPSKDGQYYPNFSDNPLMNDEIREAIRPYLLPLDHPLYSALNVIFHASRAIENDKTFGKAGFKTISRYMRVARHELLPGHLLKVFLDCEHRLNQTKRPGWLRLVDRCEGAQNIEKLIEKEKIKHFVVPEKKIYPLPFEPAPTKVTLDKEQQLAVLLVTDMELAPHEESRLAWKNKITPKHLEELYLIISHGYASTYLATNIAYTINGKFACIDTEFPQRKLHFEKVRHYLSSEMCEYWDELVRSGGGSSS